MDIEGIFSITEVQPVTGLGNTTVNAGNGLVTHGNAPVTSGNRAVTGGNHSLMGQKNVSSTNQWRALSFSSPVLYTSDLRDGYCLANLSGVNNCTVTCNAQSGNSVTCQAVTTGPFGDRLTTLALYFTFRFLSFTAVRVVFPLLDAALLEITREHKGDFGVQRLFASVGFVVVSAKTTTILSNTL